MRGSGFPSYVDYPTAVGDGWRVHVEPNGRFDARRARELGGRRVFTLWWRWDWAFVARDRRELGALLGSLRDLGVAFLAAGPGWHAGGVFELLREEGWVSGPYRALEFIGAGWRVGER